MKVLVLDDFPLYRLNKILGLELEQTLEAQVSPQSFESVYDPSAEILLYLAEHGTEYDLIVIGNNLGAGLTKAKALPVEMIDRTIVVWNDSPRYHETEHYIALGLHYFTTRSQVDGLLREHPELTLPKG